MIVILNGPPASGKDSIAAKLSSKHGFYQQEIKSSLFSMAIALSGLDPHEWFKRYNDRELKEKGWDKLGGLSQREFLIKISEEWVKPVFGNDHFGNLAANFCRTYVCCKDIVFSDCGFIEETEILQNEFGHRNTLIVHLHRDGCNFENDSRDYVFPDGSPIIRINNNGTIDEAAESICHAIMELEKDAA